MFKNYCIAKYVRRHKFGLDKGVRWNSTYLVLKHLIPYKSIFSAHYGSPLLNENHWYVVEIIFEFLEMFL